MRILVITFLLAVFSWVNLAQAQTVWKCQKDGKTTFSDSPCPSGGAALDPNRLNANTVKAFKAPPPADPSPDWRGQPTQSGRQGTSCPSELEIGNLRTKASSITLGQKEKQFLQDEVRRAEQCRAGQGQYTEDDQRRLREAQDAQSNLTGRELARRRAEAVHGSADPREAEAIERQREAEERQRASRRAAAIQAQRPIGHFSCTPQGCNGPDGYYTRRGGSDWYTSPTGRTCQATGAMLRCY